MIQIGMNKKILFMCILITLMIIFLLSFNILNYYSVNIKTNKTSQHIKSYDLLSVYIEDEDGNYMLSNSTSFDQGTGYIFNEEKSYCVNESILSYNMDTLKISVTVSGSDNCYLYFDYKQPTLGQTILMNEGDGFTSVDKAINYINSKNEPKFNETAITDEGIFATEDNDGTSYYFRGATEDNYILFGNKLWRIIRIDGQGNIKLILYNEDNKGSSYLPISLNIFNTNNYNDGTDTINAKGALNDWYNLNMVDYSGFIVETNYCVDMQEYIYDPTDLYKTYYGAFDRLVGKNYLSSNAKGPSLKCDESNLGVYEYTYSIGMISADEIVFAGGVYGSYNSNFYLKTDYYYWTISSFAFMYNLGYTFIVTNMGYLDYVDTEYGYPIFPTVSISSEILFSEGNGSKSNPYKVI